MIRVPFAPRLSAEVTAAIAIFAAALAVTPAIAFCTALITEVPWRILRPDLFSELVPSVAVAAAPLALWVVRAEGRGQLFARCFLGGAASGLVVAIGALLLMRLRRDVVFDFWPFVLLGGGFGLLFGQLCIYPALQLAAARRHRAHCEQDVQLVNTAAWVATVSAPSALLVYSPQQLWVAAVIPFTAVAVAALATVRWSLRRRWLTRLFEGQEPGWRLERLSGASPSGVPVAELLSTTGDERAIVRTFDAWSTPYRPSGERAVVARLLPDYPW